jgi:hypothetical protein
MSTYYQVKQLGDHYYPPLTFKFRKRTGDESNQGDEVSVSRYIFLNAYSEDFSARWEEQQYYGHLNKTYAYGGTGRKISIAFVLPAKNSFESENNLDYCEQLANLTYPLYSVVSQEESVDAPHERYRQIAGQIIRASFGNMIRDENVVINDFAMSIDFEAGVFERLPDGMEMEKGPNWENDYVYWKNQKDGTILPKAINVQLTMTVLHDNPLGFGGFRRPQGSVGWVANTNRDYPHGTGYNTPAAEYIKPEQGPDIGLIERMARARRDAAANIDIVALQTELSASQEWHPPMAAPLVEENDDDTDSFSMLDYGNWR